MSTTPNGKMPGMKQNEQTTSPQRAAMPPETASAVNLMAHPVAFMGAAGAIGLGLASQAMGLWLASQAMGLWMGAIAGAAEASRGFLSALPNGDAAPRPAGPAKLKLVVSKPPARKAAVSPKEAPAAPKPVFAEGSAAADDLKAISGVGPKLEKVLNGLGIRTYAQVAALDGAKIAWLDDQLGFSGRIQRDDWVGQAKKLFSGGA